jgi:hypothetical protein
LGRQPEIGHLVEKQGGAAVGVLEFAAAPADAGRGPFLDAKELGFEEGFNQRRAVDRDEGSGPPTQVVNLACDQLLATPLSPPSGR